MRKKNQKYEENLAAMQESEDMKTTKSLIPRFSVSLGLK